MNSSLMGWIIWLTERCSTEAWAGMATRRVSSRRFMPESLTPVDAGVHRGDELAEVQRLAGGPGRLEGLDALPRGAPARRGERGVVFFGGGVGRHSALHTPP